MWLPQVQWHSGNLGILTDGNNCVYRNRFQDRVKTEMQDRVKAGTQDKGKIITISKKEAAGDE